MSASKGVVLISGVNGYISGWVARDFLEAGYSIRGTVRAKGPSTDGLLRALKEHVNAGRVEIVEVPDITADGAFDEAVKGTS